MIFSLKKVLPKSILSRFILILITPVILSQVIFSVIFADKYTQIIFGIISRQMAGQAIAITKLLDMNCEEKYLNEIKDGMKLRIEVIKNTSLQKVGISKNHKAYRSLRKALLKNKYYTYYIDTEADTMDVYLPSGDRNNVYKISFPRKNLYMKIIPIVLSWGIVSSMILLIIAFIFLKNQIRPIKKLAKAAENFGNGMDTNEYVPEGAKEIRMAGASFCQMKQKVMDLMNDKMKVLAGISHDLRTPLTKMKLQLSMMPKTKEIEWLMSDVNMMIKITESFTIHAAEQNKEVFVYRNLYAFLNEISTDYKSNDFSIYLEGDKTIDIYMKYISLKRAIGNIIANAKKFAKNLYIEFSNSDNEIKISFSDDGLGIDEELSEEIFKPFTKQNVARTHTVEDGVGLGLSIARNAIIDHGGKITASNSPTYGGACFIVTLPKKLQ